MRPTSFQHCSPPNTNTTGMLLICEWTAAGDCFNCGQPPCSLGTCLHERNPEQIKLNKAKLPQYISLKQKETRHKWRNPEHRKGIDALSMARHMFGIQTNKHSKVHPTELARILKKKKQREAGPNNQEKACNKKRTRLEGDYEEREASL